MFEIPMYEMHMYKYLCSDIVVAKAFYVNGDFDRNIVKISNTLCDTNLPDVHHKIRS